MRTIGLILALSVTLAPAVGLANPSALSGAEPASPRPTVPEPTVPPRPSAPPSPTIPPRPTDSPKGELALDPSQSPARAAGEWATSLSPSDAARYAAKEANSPDAKNYRGGDTVVIGATAATVILAVVLLVVLL